MSASELRAYLKLYNPNYIPYTGADQVPEDYGNDIEPYLQDDETEPSLEEFGFHVVMELE